MYINGGIVLPLFAGVHIETKTKSLNRLVLVQKSETDIPFTNKGGITESFSLCKNLFNIDQYVLGAALGSLNLLAILSMQSFFIITWTTLTRRAS